MAVASFLILSRDYLRLTAGAPLWAELSPARQVDSLPDYTLEMFFVLTDFLWTECRATGFATHRLLPKPNLGGVVALVECLTRHDARVLHTKLNKADLCNRPRPQLYSRGSLFSYDLVVDDHELREYEGIEYLRRQINHFQNDDDYMLIVATDEIP